MCTIGGKINKKLTLFKNCDLVKNIEFYKPKIKKGKYKYIAFTRRGISGLYAGINQFGLSIVAADTYTKKRYKAKPYTVYNIFKCYEKIIADYKNVDDALNFLKKYYTSKICVPDLIIIGDKKKIAVFEFIPKKKFGIEIIKKGNILRTNQFKILKGGKNKNEDPESYIRYNNAFKIINKNISFTKLLKDHHDGPSKFSICRHGKKSEYKTQASIIMATGKKIKAYYIINNYPCKEHYKEIELC
ncbi:MAG: carcinine hydrolase/isopenicillin-N N-acyltransferase family protein [Candidatus Kuenenbacteria bacterium]